MTLNEKLIYHAALLDAAKLIYEKMRPETNLDIVKGYAAAIDIIFKEGNKVSRGSLDAPK